MHEMFDQVFPQPLIVIPILLINSDVTLYHFPLPPAITHVWR